MKKKVHLTFPHNLTDRPVTYSLSKDYRLKFNILKASIGYNVEGQLLLELEGDEDSMVQGIKYLEQLGVKVDLLKTTVVRDEHSCVHCGACTSVCLSEALSIDRHHWKVSFNDEKCVGCELCIRACPLRIISSSM